ncbi:hypothetical protein E2542_SST12456 [Spatholobus suberectus]|nr:hypothetical protein E2542_SST12456 [Spatholobus suberectus]
MKEERIYQVVWMMELKMREMAILMRRKARREKREESCRKFWMVWTKRLKLRMGGMYRVRGTAENATANTSCSILSLFLLFGESVSEWEVYMGCFEIERGMILDYESMNDGIYVLQIKYVQRQSAELKTILLADITSFS